ncbi:MAG: DNA polymerase III subunit gamma and tau [Microbacterium sp.]|uniref:DNA polymerase III subunit gamma and tau n=1 Tax=Microbacterium sp. TaxID=51671 RepID=UPI0039E5EEFB
MTTALYRRYRPETFGEMIGQAQVTEPLMTALRGDRVGHAYLFSGPRGCGKTTSARILARCLNCAQGPTDTPCGTCESCVELGRGGGGSLDVVEIDAASHNGVDDARDLRERAIFAPARDRYKIFILDEAHMVTQQGFNALLKLVEEPPDHVKFIFATTEPEKVLGTIRSRTHHYPFRLVPPAAMLDYVGALCEQEGVAVEPGVLPLVVRAGGGSPRDTLSLLDQLIAGSVDESLGYERAVALLGYTHAELLDDVVDAFAAGDAATAFSAIDRVVQTGQDPRRFVDDLLERLRDLIVIAATGQGAAAVLRGVPADELERMARQASAFGSDRLSRTADLVIAALDEMTGATSPRLQLELMVARVLTHATGFAQPAPNPAVVERASAASETKRAEPPAASAPVAPAPEPVTVERVRESWPAVLQALEEISRASWLVAGNARVVSYEDEVLTLAFHSQGDIAKFKQRAAGAGVSEDLRTAIDRVLGVRVKYLARFEPEGEALRQAQGPDGETQAPEGGAHVPEGAPPSGSAHAPEGASPQPPRSGDPAASPSSAALSSVTEWAVAPIPADDPADSSPAALAQFAVDDEPEDAAAGARVAILAPPRDGEVVPDTRELPDDESDVLGPTAEPDTAPPTIAPPTTATLRATPGVQRYGEAVVRQILGARFVREEPYEPPTRFR